MKALVVGGGGYIGSHMVALLIKNNIEVTVFDDFSTGFLSSINKNAKIIKGSIGDRSFVINTIKQIKPDCVFHFASSIQVSESVKDPSKYYRNNLSNTINIIDGMVESSVNNLIFSSTAAVYGNPLSIPINESHPKAPINPYGKSKSIVEDILKDYDTAYGLKSICLRYFNAAGANYADGLGERHYPETHLIPLLMQVASKRLESLSIYGSDYATPDGTCIRDYIHVSDLCDAHLLALKYLIKNNLTDCFNLGNGNGFSINEVISMAKKITNREIPTEYKCRRAGDPPVLVADPKNANKALGWFPKLSNLEQIIEDAWAWELKYPWGNN